MSCSVPECVKPCKYGRRFCGSHYERWRKYGDPRAGGPPRRPRNQECSYEGCGARAQRKGLCNLHYGRTEDGIAERRRGQLKYRYGITDATYDELLRRQDGRCALCPKQLVDSTGRRLAVDHDHATGAVRGLLCRSCNVVIGAVERIGLDQVSDYLAAT